MRVTNQIKNILSKIIKKTIKKKVNIFAQIEGAELNEIELKQWLGNPTTIKILKILKVHRAKFSEGIIKENIDGTELHIMRGRCRGYDDIIELLEETAANREDLEAILETYIENRYAK